jgi:cation transport ATPase
MPINMSLAIFPATKLLTPEQVIRRRRMLVRLGLAWLVMMQVMMFALPSYVRHEVSTADNIEVFQWALGLMNWASLALTVPVLLYSALPIWLGALRSIKLHRVSMDTPVAISMLAAFIPSVWATLTGKGEVYFDSISMFVAFLLTARYLEMGAQQSLLIAQSVAIDMRAFERFFKALAFRADSVAVIFIILQLSLAAIATLVWWWLDPARALPIMVSLLVMSCPCALSLAAPSAFAVAQASLVNHSSQTDSDLQELRAVTIRITAQNLYGSLAWHLFTVPFAAAGCVSPWMAALAMLLSSLAVVLNSLRISRLNGLNHLNPLNADKSDKLIAVPAPPIANVSQ